MIEQAATGSSMEGEPSPSPASTGGARKLLNQGGLVWAFSALALLLLFNLFFTPGFFDIGIREGRFYGSPIDVLNRGVPVALLAAGMALVIATGGIDLSVGAVMAISGAIAASLIARPQNSPLSFIDAGGHMVLVVGGSLLASVLMGLGNGTLVSRVGVQPIVATLILMVAGRGVAQLLTEGQIITFHHAPMHFLGAGSLLGFPVPVFIAGFVYAAMALLTRRTALGLFIEAVGNNSRACHYAGLNARTVITTVYAISGFCAGLAGLIVTADIQAADANNSGLYLELDAILAVAVGGASLTGGRFSLMGTLVGAVLIQSLTTTILVHGVPPAFTLIVKALVVILVCLLHSKKFRALFSRGAGMAARR